MAETIKYLTQVLQKIARKHEFQLHEQDSTWYLVSKGYEIEFTENSAIYNTITATFLNSHLFMESLEFNAWGTQETDFEKWVEWVLKLILKQ